MKNLTLFLRILLLFLWSNSAGQTFVLSKGSNYPTPNRVAWHSGLTSLQRSIIFDSTCIYDLGTSANADINKGFGWGVGLVKSVHSLRVGWNCKFGNGIDLFAYIHYNGKRWVIPKDSIILGSGQLIGKGFLPNVPIYCSILQSEKDLTFIATQGIRQCVMKIRFANFPKGFGRYEYPYFGGDSKSPHRMIIYLE